MDACTSRITAFNVATRNNHNIQSQVSLKSLVSQTSSKRITPTLSVASQDIETIVIQRKKTKEVWYHYPQVISHVPPICKYIYI